MSTSSRRVISIYLGLGTVIAARLWQLRASVGVPRLVQRNTPPVVHQTYAVVGWLMAIAAWPALLMTRTLIVKNREQHGVYQGVSSRWLTLGSLSVKELELEDVNA